MSDVRIASVVLLASALSASASAHPLDHLRTRNDIGLHKVPNTGVSHILVIPVRTGADGISLSEWAELQRMFDPAGGPGTFRHYWQVSSGGRYDPVPTLLDPVLYPDSCPIPGRDLTNCELSLSDIGLLLSGAIGETYEAILERVRDERQIDLAQFDVNGVDGMSDGFFDGLIFDADIYGGVALPVAVLNNTVEVESTAGSGQMIGAGIIAMSPPAFHEFGHLFGFIDLYGGPTVNGLMEDADATISAFSRQQIGWGEVVDVDAPIELALKPVLDGGQILRIGSRSQYLLIENRGGPKHTQYDSGAEGVFVYTVDESQLPTTPLGFLDVASRELYLPNATAPHLAVALPVGCTASHTQGAGACVVAPGEPRALIHESGDVSGWLLSTSPAAADGTVNITIGPEMVMMMPPPDEPKDPEPMEPTKTATPTASRPVESSGCTTSGPSSLGFGLLMLTAFALIRRRG